MRKSFILYCGLCVAAAACDKVQTGIVPDEPEVIKKAPCISNITSQNLILYPVEFSLPDSVSVTVSDAEEVTASATGGVDASVRKIDESTYHIIARATQDLGSSSSVTVFARSDAGEDSRVIDISKAYVSIDRSEFESSDAGATVSVIPSTNAGLKVSVEEPESAWIHCSGASPGYNVKIDRNTEFVPRTGRICFSDSRGLIRQYMTISQSAATNWAKLEREALEAIWNATGGQNWNQLSNTVGGSLVSTANWCTDEPVSTWYGVEVNSEGHVIYLHLAGLGLKGTLPEELGDLIYCQELHLSGNSLSGELPGRIGEMKSLKDLVADGMELSGDLAASSLAGIADHLKNLSLSGNLFSGSFPDWVSKMPAGANFWLQGNCLSGKVPQAVIAHPKWNTMLYDGSGKTVGQVNMEQREGFVLAE